MLGRIARVTVVAAVCMPWPAVAQQAGPGEPPAVTDSGTAPADEPADAGAPGSETGPPETAAEAAPAEATPAGASPGGASPGDGGSPPGAEAPADGFTDEAASRLEAPSATPDSSRRRVAVLVLATGDVPPETADALTELAIGAIASRGGLTIVGKEEFQSQLGQGEARSLECVSSTACLGRIGVELGVDELVAGTVGRRDGTWSFNLNRVDIHTGEIAGRAFRTVEGDALGPLADAIEAAIPGLYESDVATPVASLHVTSDVRGAEVLVDGALVGVYRGAAVELDDLAPGRHRIVVEAPGHRRWSRVVQLSAGATLAIDATLTSVVSPVPAPPSEPDISPLVWVGGGVAAVAGGAALWFGLSSQRDPDVDGRAANVEFVAARQTDATIANVALGAAVAGLLTATIGLFTSDFDGSDEPAGPRLGVAPLHGGRHWGSMVELEGRF